MDIKSLDLNLLLVFDAMLKYRSVTRAAEAVGLSQPAASAAVARLRSLFDDPLFVKTGPEMKATPRALALAAAVHRVVDTVRDEILQDSVFDPARAERTFTLITPDIGEVTFLPAILARLAREAPRLRLRTLALPRAAAAAALESGEAELAMGFFPDLQKGGFFQQLLFKTSYACIVCRDHPTIGERMSSKQFMAARHAIVSPDGREHVLERFLKQRHIERTVVIDVSHFMSLIAIVPGSDLIATVPREIAVSIARHAPIHILPPPLRIPPIEVHQFWHRRFQKDPANMWLRAVVHEELRH